MSITPATTTVAPQNHMVGNRSPNIILPETPWSSGYVDIKRKCEVVYVDVLVKAVPYRTARYSCALDYALRFCDDDDMIFRAKLTFK